MCEYELHRECSNYYRLKFKLEPITNKQSISNKPITKNQINIIHSITKILHNSYYNKDTATLHFVAGEFNTLPNYLKKKGFQLDEKQSIQMISDLYKQFSILVNDYKCCIYGFDAENIIVVDDTFVFVSSNYILPLQSTNTNSVTLFEPLVKLPYFSSPEIIQLTTIPATISINSFYYSLASLIIYCLTNKYILEGNDIKSEQEIKEIMNKNIKFGKLIWFLEKCLHLDPNQRKCFLI
uniref:Protein kinase domain-containing protein n=1 Tax=viral metagenome TaxID=1070528 RepID=A0A6C0IVN7_9ZZZZ